MTRMRSSDDGLEYVDEGEGSPVLLLHGSGSSPSSWQGVLPYLTERMRVLAPDLTERRDIASQVDAAGRLLGGLSVREFAAVGHGAGGLVAERLALQGAARCLVLIDAGPVGPERTPLSDSVPDPSQLAGLDIPALVVWGEEDPYLPVEQAEAVADALPHSALVLLPGCGHFVLEEAPETVGPLVAEFLRVRYLQLPHGHDHGPVPIELGRPSGSRGQA